MLPSAESHHASRVLRLAPGQNITLLDGKGTRAIAEITSTQGKEVEISVLELQTFPKQQAQIELFLAPPKSNDRLDFILEKSTELGIAAIHFIHCRNSERKNVRMDKLEQKVIAACKQSLNPWFPVLNDFQPLANLNPNLFKNSCFFHCREDIQRKSLTEISIPQHVCLFIGPEGDFSQDEIELALRCGAQSCSLGDLRLRTETAVLSAIVQLQTLYKLGQSFTKI
ncbi:MAG: RsmE family RNA methyltransferase [Luteibaculum sp.]